VRNAGWIYLLYHGKIIELGTHSDLLKNGSLYAQRYARQFSGQG
jgi:ABC-type multidrug transport system fused ATPase/permease subunit